MFQKSHIQRSTDRVCLVGIEHNFAAVVTLLESRKNVVRVIFAATTVDDMAGLGPGLTRRERLEWLVRLACIGPGVTLAIGDAIPIQVALPIHDKT